jgi:hypothetical protein
MFLHHFDKEANMLWTEEAEASLKINSSIDKFIGNSYLLTALEIVFIKENDNKVKSKFPWDDAIDFNIAWKDYSWPDFGNRLNKMNNILKNKGGMLLVVAFPLEMQLNTDLLKDDYQKTIYPQQKLSFYSKKDNIPYLDLFQTFYNKKEQGLELYVDGLHLSSEGINLAADSIYDFLFNNDYFHSRLIKLKIISP